MLDQAVELGGLSLGLADLGGLGQDGRGQGRAVGGDRELWRTETGFYLVTRSPTTHYTFRCHFLS